MSTDSATQPTDVETTPTIRILKGLKLSKTDHIQVVINLYVDRKTNEVQLYSDRVLDQAKLEELAFDKFECLTEFRIPSRSQLDRAYERSMRWYNEANRLLLNRVALRRQLLSMGLISMTLPGETPFVFERDSKGRLTDEGEAFLDDLHPSLLEVLINKFEADAGLLMV